MKLTPDEISELSQRFKNIEDVGGKMGVARKVKVAVATVYNILKKDRNVKPVTYKKVKKGLLYFERKKSELMAS